MRSAASGPGGRGALAEAGLDGEADVVVCSLGTALGSYGGVIAGDAAVLREVAAGASALAGSAAPSPPASAAALAALGQLGDGHRRVAKLQANAGIMRDALAGEGLDVTGSETQVMSLAAADDADARRFCAAALEEGVVVEPIAPPALARGRRSRAAGRDVVARRARARRRGAGARSRRGAPRDRAVRRRAATGRLALAVRRGGVRTVRLTSR